MFKAITFALAIGLSALLSTNSGALYLPGGEQAIESDTVILIRDDCGNGRHFSRSMGRCVDNDEFDRPVRRRDDDFRDGRDRDFRRAGSCRRNYYPCSLNKHGRVDPANPGCCWNLRTD